MGQNLCAPYDKMKRVEFNPPEGMRTPEGTQAGDTFESMATFQVKKDGRLCLVAIGDHTMPGYGEKDYDNPGDAVVDRYHAAMG
jgi:hypothetical protein